MSGRFAVTAAALLAALALAPGAAAEIAHDGRDTGGPLDLVSVKVGQHERHLLVKLKTDSRLPRMRSLGAHPPIQRRKPERFLCLELASADTGRRLLCPAGKIGHDRIGVGVSKIVRHKAKPKGSVRAGIVRDGKVLSLDFGLGELGLKPGRLAFSALSRWYGPACKRGRDRGGPARCDDRAPQRGSGRTRIHPVRRVGCSGVPKGKVFNGPRSRRRVALTFDDGPGPYTPQILDILDRHNVHATFFEIGEQVPAYPEVTRAVLAQGSELGNHTMRHAVESTEADIARASRLIEHASGFRPCMFRPPGGVLTPTQASAARHLGMSQVIWDVDTRDWSQPGAGTIAARATAVQPGSIVLMHDGGGPRGQTVAALPHIIENLKSRGYRLVTLTQLLGGHYDLAEVHGKHDGRRPLPGPSPRRSAGP